MDSYPSTYCGDLADPPAALKALCLKDQWIVWKWEPSKNGKGWTKPPYCADRPHQHAASNNAQTWTTHHAAVTTVLAGKAHGVGFVLTGTDIGAIDLDDCRDPETGRLDDWAREILNAAPTAYHEVTVSGTGLRVLGLTKGNTQHKKFPVDSRPGAAIEVYRQATRYITVSGFEISNCIELPNIDTLIDDIVARHDKGGNGANGFEFDNADRSNKKDEPRPAWTEHEEARIKAALGFVPAVDRQIWLHVGMSLHWTGWGHKARAIWDDWSKTAPEKFDQEDQATTWRGFRQRDKTKTLATLFALAIEGGWDNSATEIIIKDAWDDPDFSILDDRRGELPNFPTEVFAQPVEEWLGRAARGAGVHSDHVAVPLLAVASSLIGTARRVRASRSWSEPMTLWTALIAASGDRKTPGINVSLRALALIEKDSEASIRAARLVHETRAQAAKEAAKKWKDDRQAALDAKPPREPPAMPLNAIDPGNFIEPRLYATDPTIERLAALLKARPRGMLLIRDELSGLFANMGRYSGGSDRPFWLESWNGGRHVVERMSGAVIVPYLLIGVTGGFQPDKLARAFAGDEDGMYGRFLYGWPATPNYQPLTNDVSEVEPEIQNALRALINLPSEDADGVFTTQAVPLSEGAVKKFEEYRRTVDKMKRALEGRERQWLVKSESQVLRLAGTLAYLAWGFSLGQPLSHGIEGISRNLEPDTIDEVFMANAIRLVRGYLWPHARAAMRQIGMTDRHADSRRVLRWIRAHGKTEVSREDVRRDALGQKLDAEQTMAVLDALVRFGFLRMTSIASGTMGGRPIQRWQVNPKLFSNGTAETAETAETQ